MNERTDDQLCNHYMHALLIALTRNIVCTASHCMQQLLLRVNKLPQFLLHDLCYVISAKFLDSPPSNEIHSHFLTSLLP